MNFDQFKINNQLRNAIDELGFTEATEIQEKAFPVIAAGKDVIGISQTGTGKTLAYLLPLLQDLKFSKSPNPRLLILVPTRELVTQVVAAIESLTTYVTIRTLGIFGESNIRLQKEALAEGQDVLVATPGRLHDLILARAVSMKETKKLVIDEVDVMLDMGFRTQINRLFELLPSKRQNIMFSATMTDEVDELIQDFFYLPEQLTVAVSGTPLENISQYCYRVLNFNTKINLLAHLLQDKSVYNKVLVFISSKKLADLLQQKLEEEIGTGIGIIHSNKTQNHRLRTVEEFESGALRVLVATDVIARGLDFQKVSHVINMDTPKYPENYMHRIGRTGRASEKGEAILLYTDLEDKQKEAIENLMDLTIPALEFPEEVTINHELIPEERPKEKQGSYGKHTKVKPKEKDAEKKQKNMKVNSGSSYKAKIAAKYKKPKTRGDKNQNKKKR
ncbi:DEAD/DEAH box helicase [Fulvivirga sediminis]|uniref:DEAD/DEAH box helicase n=1 Tax=Fulvivirga sediminis TaxID=2803949 RepID=A0A937JZC1_9BACT|nr:DEAD/DEAH box helicase [Fulvivirga sediminis]MBL3657263.1 DEAD/DEAH box helicase [Fulvivirga sediminis]